MYTQDSEKYFTFAYSYKTVNHTEQYHCSKLFSSNHFLYFIGSIKPITYQPKSCSYSPYGESQLIYLVLKLCHKPTTVRYGKMNWSGLISLLGIRLGKVGKGVLHWNFRKLSKLPAFQQKAVGKEGFWCIPPLSRSLYTWLDHTDYKPNQIKLSVLRKLPWSWKRSSRSSNNPALCLCVRGTQSPPRLHWPTATLLAAINRFRRCGKEGSETWCSSRHPAQWAFYSFTQFSPLLPQIPKR